MKNSEREVPLLCAAYYLTKVLLFLLFAASFLFILTCLTLSPCLPDETEYEYSGSEEEDEDRDSCDPRSVFLQMRRYEH